MGVAFETTLGGNTVRENIRAACASHRGHIWYCGLDSPELHIARVRSRVRSGGHDIPTEKIYERWDKSRANLLELLPLLAELSVYDNSAQAALGQAIPNPLHVLHLRDGKLLHPRTAAQFAYTPEWAHAIMERVMELVLYP